MIWVHRPQMALAGE